MAVMASLDVTISPNIAPLILYLESQDETPKAIIQAAVNKFVSAAPKKRKTIIFVMDLP